jgi:hypothetical protein
MISYNPTVKASSLGIFSSKLECSLVKPAVTVSSFLSKFSSMVVVIAIQAKFLNKDGLATLLVDLLTKEEEETDTKTQKMQSKIPGLVLNKFNINLLSNRLSVVTDWVSNNLTIGYFGASTGAAAAL